MSLLKSVTQTMQKALRIGDLASASFTSLFLLRTVISHKSSSPPSYQANSWKIFCKVKFSPNPLPGTELRLVGLVYGLK